LGSTSSGTLTISLSDGETFSSGTSSLATPPTFFAIALSQEITSFSITTTSGQVFLDNLFWGNSNLAQEVTSNDPPPTDPAQAPEVATFLMIAGGLLLLFGSRRRWMHRPLAA
jgi:hypothetical protein